MTYSVLQNRRPAENVVPDRSEERASILCNRLELRRGMDIGDVLLKSLQVMVRLQSSRFAKL
jgi:hypothetical protein